MTEPERLAFLSESQQVTYAQFFQRILGLSAYLQQKGIQKGDRVALYGPNSFDYVIVFFALFHLRAIAVPLNTRFPTAQLNLLLQKIRCSFLILPNSEQSKFENYSFVTWEELQVPERSFSEFPTCFPFGTEVLEEDLTQEATLLFTSGSSAEPKAVLHSLGNHFFNALGANQNIPFTAEDRWLLSLPLYHVGGLAILFRVLLGRGTLVLSEEKKDILPQLHFFQITHISLVPTQLKQILETPSFQKPIFLKSILLGGSPFSSCLLQQAFQVGLPVYPTYGCTESASQVTTASPQEKQPVLTSGKVLPFRQVRLSEGGEILLKGEVLFLGYWDGFVCNSQRDQEGWYPTKDLGAWTQEGDLIVFGRKDALFISGGENIQPEEIEKILSQREEFEQVLVVPVTDEKYGMRPVAFLKSRFPWQEKVLRDWLKTQLASFKIPDYFLSWPEQYSMVGIKIVRREFQKIAEDRVQEAKLKKLRKQMD